ncbi:MAG: PglZ domain-containing protein [Polyangiaceae bacterium]|nr:PglZ domain-containing protein [Polyangiaceae bacterium]
MHNLHKYIAAQIESKLKDRRVLVWYDEPGEFQPFIDELRGGPRVSAAPDPVVVGEIEAHVAEYAGSMFELRDSVEEMVARDRPDPVVLYLSGIQRDPRTSVLMELEKMGQVWMPVLGLLGKNALLERFTLGVVDELIPLDRKASYEYLARVSADDAGGAGPSVLKVIYRGASAIDAILAPWLVSDVHDAEIADRGGKAELAKLFLACLGLAVSESESLTKMRTIALRYVLGTEFRLDLQCEPPSSLGSVQKPSTAEHEAAVRALSLLLRTEYSDDYAALADKVEAELGLSVADLPAQHLGKIDTFRFEERALLRYAGRLIKGCMYEDAIRIVDERKSSFWLDRDMGRKAHWAAVRRMAELGSLARDVKKLVGEMKGSATAWFDAYSMPKTGWYRLDQAQRLMESDIARLPDDPEEEPLVAVRKAYEDVVGKMALGFTNALIAANWSISGPSPHTRVWSDCIQPKFEPVALFMVDAMRYEMGVELSERLPTSSEVTVRALVGALPSITSVGMAALMPGADRTFDVTEERGKLGVKVQENFLHDLKSRHEHINGRIAWYLDITLDDLLGLQPSKLNEKLKQKKYLVVRCGEIDQAGEGGHGFQARLVMETVIDNLARAVRKLAKAGVRHSIVCADHGHLFFPADRDQSMRIDPPGGQTLEIHRRCWIGRGGGTPVGCVRVSGAQLSYKTDLDMVFPKGTGVFRTGGDLAYHHGGASLQEMVVPLLAMVTKPPEDDDRTRERISVSGVPETVCNRLVPCILSLLDTDPIVVRPILVCGDKQVGELAAVTRGEHCKNARLVTLAPDTKTEIYILLLDQDVESVRLVIQDPETDAELYRSANDIPVKLSVK